MPFVIANSLALHYRFIEQSADRPVLVFSNSLGTDMRIWDAMVDDLKNDYGVLLYDMRGHGLSEAADGSSTMADFADDLAGLLDHLSLSSVVLIGVSVGGMIAQLVAHRRPDLVSALVLCDTAHRIGNASMWRARMTAVESGGIASIADDILKRWFSPRYRHTDNAAYFGYRTMLCRQPAEGYIDVCRAISETDLEHSSAALSLPVLCAVGDSDGSTPPAVVQSLADLITDSRFVIIDDAGHLPCIEQPVELAGHVRRFVESVRCAPGEKNGGEVNVRGL